MEPLEKPAVEDVPDRGRRGAAHQLGVDLPDVEGEDVVGPGLGEVVDQACPISPLAPVTSTTGLRATGISSAQESGLHSVGTIGATVSPMVSGTAGAIMRSARVTRSARR
jgi:hypothetical protein